MRDQWDALIRDFGKTLRRENKARQTISIYTGSAEAFVDHLVEQDRLVPIAEITREHVGEWMDHLLATRSAATANTRYRSLQAFFRWAECEDEVTANPFDKMKPPQVPESPVPVLSLDAIKNLLGQCSGKDLINRRDTALIRLLIDTGGRISEIGGLRVDDVDLDQDTVTVLGKGSRPRILPIGTNTSLALSRYLRVRGREKQADRPELWLAEKNRGPLKTNGIKLMLRRRGRALEPPIENLHAHQFRHTAAHEWLANGGQESDLMRLMGWKSPQMLRRYGASLADERARDAHRRAGLGDRI